MYYTCLCIILAYVPIYTYMALLGQQTPKIKTNLNEKKREKFGKQEELKKKKIGGRTKSS